MRWDPAVYLRFSDERLRPAMDLLARVPIEKPARVVDLGCGAGNVTAILKQRFPKADVLGIDGSEPMLVRARTDAPDCRFAAADMRGWAPDAPVDLLYSNAALHWLDRHEALFPRLVEGLAPDGVLAVQMPAMHDSPLRMLQYEVAANGPWAIRLADTVSAPPVLDPGAYWDILRPHVAELDIWQTTYLHALQGEDAAAHWASGTSLRPFLDALAGRERAAFLATYTEALREHYPRRPDGTTLLPFQRLFILARR